MQRAPSFCGLILAAGESSRMGRSKALLPWKGGTFLSEAIRALNDLTDLVIVVAGKNAEQLRPIVDTYSGFLVVNPQPELGQFNSLQVGVQEILNRGRDAGIVTLVDRPPARLETIELLKNEFLSRAEQGTWSVVPEFEGQHGHPIVIGREMISCFLNAPPTSNARAVQHSRQEHIAYVGVSDPFVAMNIDTPQDLERLTALTPESTFSK